ncbi:TraC family protein [Pseudaminobacter salicylatoxidans]|uniref:TraC-like protein n=1 Tax=Pseudaminobacter salicylatoxidans TaxID=93369 RepID=A0A316BKX3_PSESE|nr:TraC family protein [Pseudaminobacter salicylatoxidans]PWJ73377.1 TraC-like protein [Pseudaminobacter salicylatoxidans]|tara:strand:+ start:59 stop:283 length:225 start_codon:yes stop_codon:yes gene_type:complete
MARKAKTPAQIKAEMERLKQELKEAEAKEADRLGALAIKAGLHEIEASDADLVKAMKEVAARFQTARAQPGKTA